MSEEAPHLGPENRTQEGTPLWDIRVNPPIDQLDRELALVEKYEGSAMAPVLAKNLTILKMFNGIGVPGQIDPRSPIRYPGPSGAGEELEDRSTISDTRGPKAMSSLWLHPPGIPLPLEEFDKLSPVEKYKHSKSIERGATVGMAYPWETQEMLVELYTLTNAQVLRDDTSMPESVRDGSMVRVGNYGGTTIYFMEAWKVFEADNDLGAKEEYTVRYAEVYGADWGEVLVKSLTSSDYEFLSTLGTDPKLARDKDISHQDVAALKNTADDIRGL